MICAPNLPMQLPILLLFPIVLGESLRPQSLECSEAKPSTVCLTKGYSTFELPLRHKENLVKIGRRDIYKESRFGSTFNLEGFEISDVLAINDKDYTITFGLYFSAEWLEPRLNLSTVLWGKELVEKDDDLVPGK